MITLNKITPIKTEKISRPQNVVSAVSTCLTELSKDANDGIVNLQKGLINIKKTNPKLNKSSIYCRFFGADNADNVQRHLDNQMALSWFKRKEQNIVRFPSYSIDTAEDILANQKDTDRRIEKLKTHKVGRWTFLSNVFSHNGEQGTHTVGLVYDRDTLWILDSLSEANKEVKQYHKIFRNIFGKYAKEIKFSEKPQQTMDEYTCNNWTHANIDAVLAHKGTPLNKEVLDKILPDNINTILESQHNYIKSKLNGREFFDIVAESHK
jgi:hypothetical protein